MFRLFQPATLSPYMNKIVIEEIEKLNGNYANLLTVNKDDNQKKIYEQLTFYFQRYFQDNNPLHLTLGSNLYKGKNKILSNPLSIGDKESKRKLQISNTYDDCAEINRTHCLVYFANTKADLTKMHHVTMAWANYIKDLRGYATMPMPPIVIITTVKDAELLQPTVIQSINNIAILDVKHQSLHNPIRDKYFYSLPNFDDWQSIGQYIDDLYVRLAVTMQLLQSTKNNNYIEFLLCHKQLIDNQTSLPEIGKLLEEQLLLTEVNETKKSLGIK